MKSLHIRRGDTVQVLKGKDAGKRGKVLKVDPVKRRVVIGEKAVAQSKSRKGRIGLHGQDHRGRGGVDGETPALR